MIFEGKKIAETKTEVLKKRLAELEMRPSLVIFQVGQDPASKVFVDLKVKKALELGIVVEHINLAAGDIHTLEALISEKNEDDSTHGVMVQLPMVGVDEASSEKILKLIDPKKDADGLNPKSGVRPAVVRAVMSAYEEYVSKFGTPRTIAVVGSKGNLGKQFMDIFGEIAKTMGFDLGDDQSAIKEADLVILCTGKAGVVNEEMLKEGTGVIDLGATEGEFLRSSKEYSGFLTPVPGGIGPVTVISLFENLCDLVFERSSARI